MNRTFQDLEEFRQFNRTSENPIEDWKNRQVDTTSFYKKEGGTSENSLLNFIETGDPYFYQQYERLAKQESNDPAVISQRENSFFNLFNITSGGIGSVLSSLNEIVSGATYGLVDIKKLMNSLLFVEDYIKKNNEVSDNPNNDNVGFFSKLTPKFGNFAGPNYSAGRYMEKVNVDEMIYVDSVNALDEATKIHDMLYSLATTPDDMIQADRILLIHLDEIQSAGGLDNVTQRYLDMARLAFNAKIYGSQLNENSLRFLYPVSPNNLSYGDRMRLYDYVENSRKYGLFAQVPKKGLLIKSSYNTRFVDELDRKRF